MVQVRLYPELFAVVGGTLPDYRGLFLRGVGGNSGLIGQFQKHALSSEEFTLSMGMSVGFAGSSNFSGIGDVHLESVSVYRPQYKVWGETLSPLIDVKAKFNTPSTETIPSNKAVRYLVRSK